MLSHVLPAGRLLPVDVTVKTPLLGDPSFEAGGHSFPARQEPDGKLSVRFNPVDPELVFDPDTFSYGIRSEQKSEDGLLYRRHQEYHHPDGSATYIRDEYTRPDGKARAYFVVTRKGEEFTAAHRLERPGEPVENVPYTARFIPDLGDIVLSQKGLLGHLRENGGRGLGTWWRNRSNEAHIITPYSRVLYEPFRYLPHQLESEAPPPSPPVKTGIREEGGRVLIGGVALKKRLGA